jgi:protein-disulfide isomerase
LKKLLTSILLAALAAFAGPAGAQPLTKEQGDAILQELKAIRQLLERQQQPPRAQGIGPAPAPAAPERVKVGIGESYTIGAANAPVTMVAFVDYECPFCKRFDVQTYPQLKKQYIDTGKLRYVIRDLPLEFHKRAMKAAEASYCAAEQGKFWEMRDKLIVNAERLNAELLPGYAKEIGLADERFRGCLDSGKYVPRLQKSLDDARALGITGTPTFVIGKSSGDTVEGVKVVGAQPYASFEQHIKSLLDGK